MADPREESRHGQYPVRVSGRCRRGFACDGRARRGPRRAAYRHGGRVNDARRFDAIIVGAGQAGPSLAGRLTQAGRSVALVERKLFGGTCINTGCMPTKTLVASARAAHVARRAADFGVLLEGEVRIDMAKVKSRADIVIARSEEQTSELQSLMRTSS